MIARLILRRNGIIPCARFYTEGTSQSSSGGYKAPPSSVSVNADVPGLSPACVQPAAQPVGPGVDPNKSGAYKVPEYFCYNNMSFFEAEVEMSKYRCPQPSALKK